MLQDQLGKVGINLDLQRLDRAAAIKLIYLDWNYDIALWVLATGPEPTMQVTRSYVTDNIKPAPFTNASGYSNPETDRLFHTEASIVDVGKRKATWFRLQEILMTDLPFIPLIEMPVTNFVLESSQTSSPNPTSIHLTSTEPGRNRERISIYLNSPNRRDDRK